MKAAQCLALEGSRTSWCILQIPSLHLQLFDEILYCIFFLCYWSEGTITFEQFSKTHYCWYWKGEFFRQCEGIMSGSFWKSVRLEDWLSLQAVCVKGCPGSTGPCSHKHPQKAIIWWYLCPWLLQRFYPANIVLWALFLPAFLIAKWLHQETPDG